MVQSVFHPKHLDYIEFWQCPNGYEHQTVGTDQNNKASFPNLCV